jgi:hypothetical protein
MLTGVMLLYVGVTLGGNGLWLAGQAREVKLVAAGTPQETIDKGGMQNAGCSGGPPGGVLHNPPGRAARHHPQPSCPAFTPAGHRSRPPNKHTATPGGAAKLCRFRGTSPAHDNRP